MRRLLILVLLVGLASSADALVVDLRADGVDTLEVMPTPSDPTVRISVYSDTDLVGYEVVVTIDNYGTTSGLGSFTDMTITAAAGGDAYLVNPYYGYSWAWLVVAKDVSPPNTIAAGEQFYFDYTLAQFTGEPQIVDLRNHDLTWSLIESMTIMQIPEPVTITLLGLGSLLLLRHRKH